MILAGGHRQDVLAVDHHNKASLFAIEELFNHDAVACVAKGVAGQHIFDRRFGFLEGHRHDNAFTRRQTVGFDDDRRAFLAQISQRWLNVGEVLIFRRRDMMTSKEIFGEGLRTFQLRSAFGWPEDGQPGGTKRVNHANDQRRFRANDGQVDIFILGEAKQRRNIGNADGDVLQRRLQRGTGVAWRDVDGINQRRLGRFPGQGVFAPAVADY